MASETIGTEERWSTEVERPRKSSTPRWLLGCGIGCGLLMILGLLVGAFMWRGISRMTDPEVQWAAVDEVLPVVERPEGFRIMGTPRFIRRLPQAGFRDMWAFGTPDSSASVVLIVFEAEPEPPDWDKLFDPSLGEEDQPELVDGGGFLDAELGTLAVQGRELRVLRFRTQRPEDEPPAGEGSAPEADGEQESEPSFLERFQEGVEAATRFSAARVDLTPAAGAPLILLEYHRNDSLERVGDEELTRFLATFDLSAD